MGQFDLQSPLGGRRAFAEYFEDQSGPVDHLAARFILQRLLLDRAKRGIDHQQRGLVLLGQRRDLLDLALAEQAGRTQLAKAEGLLADDVDADRLGQTDSFGDPRVERS
jgi:hypothetical protein